WPVPARPRRPQRVHIAVAAALASIVGATGCSRTPPPPERSAALERAVAALPEPFAHAAGSRAKPIGHEARHFYQRHDFHLAWSDGRRPRPAMAALVQSLRASRE